MIVILGATGKVGRTAAAELRRRGRQVTGVLRDRAKGHALAELGCALAEADLRDRPSLERALAGASTVLAICPPPVKSDDVLADAQQMIDQVGGALEAARPRAVVAISDYGVHHPSGTGVTLILRRLEDRLRALPAAVTFLRSAEQMQNWLRHAVPAHRRGVLPSLHHPVTRPFPTISAFDVGRIAADLLDQAETSTAVGLADGNPRVVHVEGPRRYAAVDFAAAFARLFDSPVVAQAIDRDQWTAALAAGGLGDSYARLVAELQDAHNAGRIDVEPGVGELRRGTTDLFDALSTAVSAA